MLRGALPVAHRGGRRRNVRLISIAAHRRLRPSNLLWLHCGPRRSSHHKSPVMILLGVLVGISGSGPPPQYAHYNLLLPTVPHENPSARPLRFSIGPRKRCRDGWFSPVAKLPKQSATMQNARMQIQSPLRMFQMQSNAMSLC